MESEETIEKEENLKEQQQKTIINPQRWDVVSKKRMLWKRKREKSFGKLYIINNY